MTLATYIDLANAMLLIGGGSRSSSPLPDFPTQPQIKEV